MLRFFGTPTRPYSPYYRYTVYLECAHDHVVLAATIFGTLYIAHPFRNDRVQITSVVQVQAV